MNTSYNYNKAKNQLKRKQEAKQRGVDGEQKAVDYLISKNYKILHRNWRTKRGEIDIIATDNEYTVFIEVKTRAGNEYGTPSEAVDRKKQEKYFKVAQYYLQREKKIDTPCRFDVVEIEKGEINHIFDAFSM